MSPSLASRALLRLKLAACALAAAAFAGCAIASSDAPVRASAPQGAVLRVTSPQAKATVDERIFGQFMEREDNRDERSEIGPEAALQPGKSELRPDVWALAREMASPTLRFPAGGSVEYGRPWWWQIGHAPRSDTPSRRPGYLYGFDEFLRDCERLKAEPLLVVALTRYSKPWLETTREQMIEEAAELVAYCNGRLDGGLSPALRPWAEARAANGRAEPWGVKLWQVGNEPFWAHAQERMEKGATPEEIARSYVEDVEAVIDAMRAVDPTIKIFVEVQMARPPWSAPIAPLFRQRLAGKVDYLTSHYYESWAVKKIERADGSSLPGEEFTAADYWRAAASAGVSPDSTDGQSMFAPDFWEPFRDLGKPFAVTEWNFNLWWELKSKTKLPRGLYARGVGSASILHGMLRAAGDIKLANQSMLIGRNWELAAIGVSAKDPARPAVWRPTGQALTLHRRHHGRELLATELTGGETYSQPFKLGNIQIRPRVAYVDALATRTGDTVYVHALNRDGERARTLTVDVSALGRLSGPATLRALLPVGDALTADAGRLSSAPLPPTRGGRMQVSLPAGAIAVIELKVRPKP